MISSAALWQRAPLLFYALFLLLAPLFALKSAWALLFIPIFLWKQPLHKAFLALLLFLSTLGIIFHLHTPPSSGTESCFLFQIDKIFPSKKPFSTGFFYKGIIKSITFAEGNKKQCSLPALYYSHEPLTPKWNYLIQGVLYTKKGQLSTIIGSAPPLQKEKKTFSFFAIRETGKAWFKKYLSQYYSGRRSLPFLLALTTGINDDVLLKSILAQIGCSHLLAISGFHFALVAGFCHVLLKPFFHYKKSTLLLLFFLFCYLLFLGKSASVYRAFIFSATFFSAHFLERRSVPINTLGIALGLSLFLDPLMALNIGFQLSFLATASLITFYSPLYHFLCPEGAGKLVRFFFSLISVNLAVHFALIPLSLLYFHAIPLHSFFYNLFFPTLTAGTLIFFLIALLLPPFAPFLHGINDRLTESYLLFVENRPLYEYSIYLENTPAWFITLFFLFLYSLTTFIFSKKQSTIVK